MDMIQKMLIRGKLGIKNLFKRINLEKLGGKERNEKKTENIST